MKTALDQLVAHLTSVRKPHPMRRILGTPGKSGGKPAYVSSGEKYGIAKGR